MELSEKKKRNRYHPAQDFLDRLFRFIRKPIGSYALFLFLITVVGCTRDSRWTTETHPGKKEIKHVIEGIEGEKGVVYGSPHSFPQIPMRRRLRPCCTLGEKDRTTAGEVLYPGNIFENIRAISTMGVHEYDSGTTLTGTSGDPAIFSDEENNGLVYTCRGGFIDTAQVRDYADWTVLLTTRFGRKLRKGTIFHLPKMGGSVEIQLKPIPQGLLTHLNHRTLAILLARWAAGKLAVWHEIATWYGWSCVSEYPELSSAFSPEDFYSKLLGIKLAAAIAARHLERSENLYNRSMTLWLEEALKHLGATDHKTGRAAAFDVKGVWWDDSKPVGTIDYLLRRKLDMGTVVRPWLLRPKSKWLTSALKRQCGPNPTPAPLHNPESVREINFADWVTLKFTVSGNMSRMAPFHKLGKTFTQEQFDEILSEIRKQLYERFGSDADKPYPVEKTDGKKSGSKKSITVKHIEGKSLNTKESDDQPQKGADEATEESDNQPTTDTDGVGTEQQGGSAK